MPIKMSPSERRRQPRIPQKLSLRIAQEEGSVEAETTNISASGAYCVLSSFIEPMTKLALAFEVTVEEATETIECTGVVVRVEPEISEGQKECYNTAIFFSDITEKDKRVLEAFIQNRLQA